jgi:hypothetical protein
MADIEESDAQVIDVPAEEVDDEKQTFENLMGRLAEGDAALKKAIVIGSAEGTIRIDLGIEQSADQFKVWLEDVSTKAGDRAGKAILKYKLKPTSHDFDALQVVKDEPELD